MSENCIQLKIESGKKNLPIYLDC